MIPASNFIPFIMSIPSIWFNLVLVHRLVILHTNSWAFAYFLVNVSSLSDTILTCSNYISNCLWLYLANNEGNENTNRSIYIATANIGSIYARNTYIGNTCTIDIWIGYTSIWSIYIRCIYVTSIFIYYFLLSMRLILTLINKVSYCVIKKSNLDWRNIHTFNVWYIFF